MTIPQKAFAAGAERELINSVRFPTRSLHYFRLRRSLHRGLDLLESPTQNFRTLDSPAESR
jgi:hypothetical protein